MSAHASLTLDLISFATADILGPTNILITFNMMA